MLLALLCLLNMWACTVSSWQSRTRSPARISPLTIPNFLWGLAITFCVGCVLGSVFYWDSQPSRAHPLTSHVKCIPTPRPPIGSCGRFPFKWLFSATWCAFEREVVVGDESDTNSPDLRSSFWGQEEDVTPIIRHSSTTHALRCWSIRSELITSTYTKYTVWMVRP